MRDLLVADHDSTDDAVAVIRADRAAVARGIKRRVEGMVVVGRAWTEEQRQAAEVLFAVADGLEELAGKLERGEALP